MADDGPKRSSHVCPARSMGSKGSPSGRRPLAGRRPDPPPPRPPPPLEGGEGPPQRPHQANAAPGRGGAAETRRSAPIGASERSGGRQGGVRLPPPHRLSAHRASVLS